MAPLNDTIQSLLDEKGMIQADLCRATGLSSAGIVFAVLAVCQLALVFLSFFEGMYGYSIICSLMTLAAGYCCIDVFRVIVNARRLASEASADFKNDLKAVLDLHRKKDKQERSHLNETVDSEQMEMQLIDHYLAVTEGRARIRHSDDDS